MFKDEDPKLAKGDFVVFMGRDGKPMSVLTVMAFQLAKVPKTGKEVAGSTGGPVTVPKTESAQPKAAPPKVVAVPTDTKAQVLVDDPDSIY